MRARSSIAGLAALWLTLAAHAADSDVPDLIEQVGSARINWTRLVVEASSVAERSGVGARHQAVEQAARDDLGPALVVGAEAVRVAGAQTVAGLADLDGTAVRDRLKLWDVVEARYYRSGRVELDGELSLQELLKPWVLAASEVAPDPGAPTITGIVVDARGLGFSPVYAPRLVSVTGESLFSGVPWRDAAVRLAPVVYVPAASHPAVARAGERPMLVAATQARPGELVLSEVDAAAIRLATSGSRVLGDGTIVVVVDP